MKYCKKLLILLGIISISNEFSAFEVMKSDSKKINTPKELADNHQISKNQYDSILNELKSLEDMSEEEKSEFYKKMLKEGVYISGPIKPCDMCP